MKYRIYCNDSPLHAILGNEQHFIEAAIMSEWSSKFCNSIYLNFTIGNNVHERMEIIDLLRNQTNVRMDSPKQDSQGRIEYLANLRKYDFVPCPIRNGVDTHRIWETLYMGGTPVIKSNPVFAPLVAKLPVVQVSKWQELLDYDHMFKKWKTLQSKKYSFQELSLDYQLWRIKK